MRLTLLAAATAAALWLSPTAHATPTLIASGSLTGTADLSGLKGTLENGNPAGILGGSGSALAWAGGSTFLALPDRGPNATAYAGGGAVDNTTSYIPRFHTVSMALTPNAAGAALAYTLVPTLQATTLLSSATPLNYGSTAGLPAGNGVNAGAPAGTFYFSGRSDNYGAGSTANPANARLDPEGMRVSPDGKTVYVSDEYGPYVYAFDRATGQRIRTFALPAGFAAPNPSAAGAAEIAGNTVGRVANKGMEGLAITPDGKTLVGFMQGPLIQDGGDGARYNRIVAIDVATGATRQYAYDNQIGGKTYNSSEIVAVNDHQFLVLERDGKGLGDGSKAAVKRLMQIDIAGAQDVGDLSGAAALAGAAIVPTTFLDIRAALNAAGISDGKVPSKLEGLAFGEDLLVNDMLQHTLWIANDNDFVSATSGPNSFYVFAFTDADLPGFVAQRMASSVPEPASWAVALTGLCLLGAARRRKRGR
jgi:MYXO-CTERM domain-containing protein